MLPGRGRGLGFTSEMAFLSEFLRSGWDRGLQERKEDGEKRHKPLGLCVRSSGQSSGDAGPFPARSPLHKRKGNAFPWGTP